MFKLQKPISGTQAMLRDLGFQDSKRIIELVGAEAVASIALRVLDEISKQNALHKQYAEIWKMHYGISISAKTHREISLILGREVTIHSISAIIKTAKWVFLKELQRQNLSFMDIREAA